MSRKRKVAAAPMPQIGDSVMLSSPLVDPVHWWVATVLWTDGAEILVHQGGIGGASPHNQLHDVGLVRAFGTLEHVAAEKRRAEKIVRDAARQCLEVEEMAAELRRKLIDVFEIVARKAIETSQQARAGAE